MNKQQEKVMKDVAYTQGYNDGYRDGEILGMNKGTRLVLKSILEIVNDE